MKRIFLALAFVSATAFGAPSVVELTATSSPSGSSHNLGLGSVAAGDRLLVLYTRPTTGINATFPAGWTKLIELTSGGIFGHQKCGLGMAYRDADGTEGSSVTITVGGTPPIEAAVYRIQGHDPATAPAFAKRYGNNGNPGSSTLVAPWGIADTLWVAATCKAGSTLTAFPTNYVNDQYSINASPMFALASRVATQQTENFGSFVTSGGYGWATFAIGIKP